MGLFSGITGAIGGLLGGGGGGETTATSNVTSDIDVNVTNEIDLAPIGTGLEALGKGLEVQSTLEHEEDAKQIEAQKQIAAAEIAATGVIVDVLSKRLTIAVLVGIVIFATRNKWSKIL